MSEETKRLVDNIRFDRSYFGIEDRFYIVQLVINVIIVLTCVYEDTFRKNEAFLYFDRTGGRVHLGVVYFSYAAIILSFIVLSIIKDFVIGMEIEDYFMRYFFNFGTKSATVLSASATFLLIGTMNYYLAMALFIIYNIVDGIVSYYVGSKRMERCLSLKLSVRKLYRKDFDERLELLQELSEIL